MNKNRIRLSESQLHQVIKESVKKVLSELDWKTYQNAANKMAERDGWTSHSTNVTPWEYLSPQRKAERMAKKSFEEQYPKVVYNGGSNPYLRRSYEPFSATYQEDSDGNGNLLQHNRYGRSGWTSEVPSNDDLAELFGQENIDTYRTAKKEKEDYQKGNYEYKKGKGWQKKDGLD